MIRFILFAMICTSTALPSTVFAIETTTNTSNSLFSALKSTLKLNPRVLTERNKIVAFSRDLASEKMQRLPALSVLAEVEDSDDSKGLIRVLQPLWVGGRIDNAIVKAEIQLKLADTELLRVQRELMEQTAVTYANLLGLKERIKAAEMNIKEHQRLLDLINRRQEGNISSMTDVQLAQSRLYQATLQNEDLKGQLQRTRTELYALTLTRIKDHEPVPTFLTDLPGHAQIESTVVKVSARLAQAKLEIEKSRMDVALSKSEAMPRVYGRLEQELYNRGNTGQNLDTSVGLVIEGTLQGAGFSNWERIKSADARVRATRMQSDSENNDIRRNTLTLLSDRDMFRQFFTLNQSLVQSTAKTLTSYFRQYEAGRKSWLDLLNIQQEHARARLTLEQVRSSLEQVGLRLAVQMGRLDSLSGINP